MAQGSLTARAIDCWQRAATVCDVTNRHVIIGGRHLALRLVGAPLATAVLPALDAHPEADSDRSPDLEILGWDAASTGIDFPLNGVERQRVPAWRRRTSSSEVPLSGQRLLDQTYEGTFSVLDDGVGVHWSRHAAELPYWERAAPLIHVLHWWQRAHGLHVVHAGAVGRDGRGVLLAGPSGSGKSTTTLACRAAGWQYVGDDYTLLEPTSLRVHHLYRSAKLLQANEGLVDGTHGVPADGRWMYFLDGITESLDIVAVIAPTVNCEGPTRLTRQSSGFRGLAAMGPSTISQLPGSGASDLAAMRRVCMSVPCYTLELGGAPTAVPAILEEVLT